MIDWTDSATETFERHCADRAAALRAAGADPDEVREDLRAHLEEEFLGRGQAMITADDVGDFLRRRGLVDPPSDSTATAAMAPQSPSRPIRHLEQFFHVVCGILLPLAAVIMEFFTHITADVAFDPIPSGWHLALVAFVPLANLAVWNAVRAGVCRAPRLMGWMSGAAVTISGLYALMYIPLIPVSLFGALVMGIGLLGLTPHTAFISALRLRFLLSRRERLETGRPLPGLFPAALLVFAFLTVLHAPATLTRVGLIMATSESPETRLSGIRWLRRVGNEEALLRACYFRSGMMQDPAGFALSFGDPVTPAAARIVYYRVTGRSFNSARRPSQRGFFGREDFEWDDDMGGSIVGGQVSRLQLDASRIDASLDADAGLGYIEWTLEFKNSAMAQAEARAEMLLPSGAVVSRLTLWIDGEEREAAFAGRGQVRQAYESVVQRRRDPVLVTTRGRDRILVQCFPVPPNGGTMKIRLGITTPLSLNAGDEAEFVLPRITERNFAVPESLRHTTWLASRGGFRDLPDELPGILAGSDVRGGISEPTLSKGLVIRTVRSSGVDRIWCESRDTAFHIVGEWRDVADSPPARLVVVVDGSGIMASSVPAIATWLESLPSNRDLHLLIADDASSELPLRRESIRHGSGAELATVLRAARFEGGVGNLPALEQAWNTAAEIAGGAVLWIHGPQPEPLANSMAIEQMWDRAENGPILYTIAAVEGPNHILRDLAEEPRVISYSLGAGLPTALSAWGDRYFSGKATPRLMTTRLGSRIAVGDARRTSDHLDRLWAAAEVERLLASNKSAAREEAVKLAADHQIVTAVTGAVVLETQQQFEAAGLTPVDPASVPTIPEPATIILILIVLLVIGFVCFSPRRRWA